MNTIERLINFNKNRIPQLLPYKYARMRADAFRFYRGTGHLFYEDNYKVDVLNNSPLTWLSGDLHVENFGVYKGDDRDLYFDINDFDEAALGPAAWDISRFVCSILVADNMLKIKSRDAINLATIVLKHYATTMVDGHSRRIERGKAMGVLEDLMETLNKRRRKKFIASFTELNKGVRQLSIMSEHDLTLSAEEKEKLRITIKNWAAAKPNPDFYNVLDSDIRITGTGSVGVERYILLVEGKGGVDGSYLLDLKCAAPCSLVPYLNPTIIQLAWTTEAHRVVTLQKRMQAVFPAMLDVVEMDNKSFLIKELQPSTDKLDLARLAGDFGKIGASLTSFADILAWAQLRSSGRQGSAIADTLIEYGSDARWQKPLLDFCITYCDKVMADYKMFSEAYDDHAFDS